MSYDLSVVIVTWNCQDVCRIALRHLFESRTALRLQVILVDNDSKDGTPELVERDFPQVQVIRSGANLGFGKGNNLGIRHAEGRHIMLLNPDAYLTDDRLLDDLVAWLDQHADFGAVGCRIIFPDGTHQVGDAGYRPSAAAMIFSALGFTRLSSRFHGVFMVGSGDRPDRPLDVDWICGAFMLVRRAVWLRTGGFDESIFMYGEDVEWGCRVRDLGIRIAYLPWRKIVHVQGATQYVNSRAKVSTVWLDNLVLVHRRLNGAGAWRFVRFCMTCGFLLRALVYRVASVLIGRPALVNKSGAMWLFARHVWSIGR